MGKIVVTNHLSLDGVMQAPGEPDEDRRGGFDQGGWAANDNDEVMGKVMGEGMSDSGSMLLGRRTPRSQLRGAWCSAAGPMTASGEPGPTGPTVTPSLMSSTRRRSMWPHERCRNRCRGRTRPCSTATQRTPWPS